MTKLLAMNWADYAIIGIIAFSILVSVVRGFVREAVSLFTWLIAIWVAFSFSRALSSLTQNYIHSASLREIASFAALFIATLLLGAFVNFLVSQLVDKTGLSGSDRILGIVFGAARGLLVVALMLMLAGLTPMPESPWWKSSVIIPQFQPIETWLHSLLPKSVTDHLKQVSY